VTYQTIAGPAGKLQLLQEMPTGPAQALAIICHPHPLHGGTLNNKIVHQLARTFNQLGAVSVRFNFRGVGDSAGEFDKGRGEVLDLQAVAAWAQRQWPGLPLWLAGFSFGGFVAIMAAAQLQPERLVTVAPAVTYFSDTPLRVSMADWLVIQGKDDDVVPAAAVQAFIQSQNPSPALVLVEGAGHFFHGRLNVLKQAVTDAFSDG
jgi:alpha/beta superfamily hydrolase